MTAEQLGHIKLPAIIKRETTRSIKLWQAVKIIPGSQECVIYANVYVFYDHGTSERDFELKPVAIKLPEWDYDVTKQLSYTDGKKAMLHCLLLRVQKWHAILDTIT